MFGEPVHHWPGRVFAAEIVVQADRLDDFGTVERVQRISRGFRSDPAVWSLTLIVDPQLHGLIVPSGGRNRH